MFPKNLQQKLETRKSNNALRQLGNPLSLVDFSSNDYLGFAKSKTIFNNAHEYLIDCNIIENGATGSRLLTGNHQLYNEVESMLCEFHNSEAALVFNSGYDANIGFFSSVPQRGDVILYDEYIHASIRDGIKLSNSQAYKFKHNDLEDLQAKILRLRFDSAQRDTQKDNTRHSELVSESHQNIYIVTESVFSMDGDTPDLVALSQLCKKYQAHLIVDEAHAIGIFGKNGCGLVQKLGLENDVFARLVTFGKAMGWHGAAILGSETLKQYLVNFARSFIYTTGLPPHSLATIKSAYDVIKSDSDESKKIHNNILHFKSKIKRLSLNFIESNSAIHCCIISGNNKVKQASNYLKEKGFNVKAIMSPTVPGGQERLRFCLHSYNSKEEITKVLELLATFVTI